MVPLICQKLSFCTTQTHFAPTLVQPTLLHEQLWLKHHHVLTKTLSRGSGKGATFVGFSAVDHPPGLLSRSRWRVGGGGGGFVCKAQHKGRVGIYSREGNISLASFGLKVKKDKRGSSVDITKSLSMLLPYIVIATAALALSNPASFSWVRKDFYALLLGGIMLSIGVQLSIADFALIFQKPLPLIIGYFSQYALKPLLGVAVAQAFSVPPQFYSGFILTACVAGAQLSSYAAFLSGGDIALSIVLTSLTTISSVIVTPVLTGFLIGSIVPVDVVAMAKSILQVVFLPICIGLALNTYAKPIVDRLRILMPLLAMFCTSLCIGSPLALNQSRIVCIDGLQLLFPVLAFHAGAFLLGHLMSRFPTWRQDRKVSRTLSLCTGMQSSTLAMLLATQFLGGTQAVPPACSVVVMAIMGLSLASFWGSSKSKCTYVSKRADLFEGRLYA